MILFRTLFAFLYRALPTIFSKLITFFLVISAVFFITNVLPGDPARIVAGELATWEEVESIRQQLNLHLPLTQRYLLFLKSAVTFDFGKSLVSGQDVRDLVFERAKNTAELSLMTVLLILIETTIFFALLSKWKRSFQMILTAIYSIPNFWLGILFIIVFSVKLKFFPPSGYEGIQSLFLPALTLSISLAVVLSSFLRKLFDEIEWEDFVLFAKARGLDRIRIFLHILKNALPPTSNLFMIQLGVLLTGTVVTETVFSFPGIGLLTVQSIYSRDFPVLWGCVAFISAVWIVVNSLSDILMLIFDPRTRKEK